ncbi:MAG: amidohydrolase [Actinobacteria bacterium]|nr:amidohydrolase [Actinomycetota bacterium]
MEAAIRAVEHDIADRSRELVALRRDLHRHPEPSWEEHRTTAVLLDRLRAAGLDPRPGPTGTGVVCDIGAAGAAGPAGDAAESPGPLVALRGDIDALRLPDTKDVPYRSEVDGVCHACGHDVHTAAALGAGLALAEVARHGAGLPGGGRVRLLLQPAEETVPGGARALCDAGAMDGVGAIFALHCDPSVEVGRLGLSAGPIGSAADYVTIRLKGPGGHTARPHLTADLGHLVGRVLVDLPAGLARLSDSRDGVNLTFGMVQAGDAPNAIPSEAVLGGSLRATGRVSWQEAGPKLQRLLAAIVEPFGARWELDHRVGAPPLVNDPWAVGVADRAARRVLGDDAVEPTRQSAGGEDFSWYLDHAPGAYLRLGVRARGAGAVDIHSSAFDVDESAVALGASVLAASALCALHDLA